MQSIPLLYFSASFCRNKSARTITYNQFREAISELGRKRFKDKTSEEAAEEVFKMIEGKSPVISGVTVITDMTSHDTATNSRFKLPFERVFKGNWFYW